VSGKVSGRTGAFFCGAFLAALAFSAFFIAVHADHVCSAGEYCPVCAELQAAVNLLRHCGPVPARLSGGCGFFGAAELLKFFPRNLTKLTSVSLKIRMNT
jgi:hypothetical protein